MSEEREWKKVVFIGDGASGKTCVLDVFEKGEFVDTPYRPTIFHNTEKRIKHPTLEGVEVTLHL